MGLEDVGFRAVFADVGKFEAAGRRVKATSDAIAKAQLNAAAVSQKADVASRLAANRIADAEKTRAQAVETSTRRVISSRAALATAQRKVDAASKGSLAAQLAAQEGYERAVRSLELARLNRRYSIERADTALSRASQNARDVGIRNANDLSKANLALAVAGAKPARSFNLASTALGTFSTAGRAAGNVTNALGRGLISITGFSNRFAVALKFGVAAVGALTAAMAIGTASKFETQLAKIDNLTNTTSEDTVQLGKDILQMSKSIPKSPDELGAAAYQIYSSGISSAATAHEILDKSAKASVIGLGQTKDIASVLTAVLNAYGEANISASDAADILVGAVKEGRGEASEFANTIGRILPVAAAMGVEFDDVAASLASLTNVGLDASKAETALLGIMNQLLSPSAEAAEQMKNYGSSMEEVRTILRDKGINAALEFLNKTLGNNIQAFENLFPEVRGMTGALQLLGQSDKAAKVLDQVRNSAGITEDAFARSSKTFEFQANLLKNQLSIALTQIGSAVLPALTAEVAKLLGWLGRNEEAIKNLANEIVRISSGVIKNFIVGIQTINNALAWIPTNERAITIAVFAIGAAMTLAFGGPLTILLGIVTALGVIKTSGASIADSISSKLGLPTSERGGDLGTQAAATTDPAKFLRERGVDKALADTIAEGIEKVKRERGNEAADAEDAAIAATTKAQEDATKAEEDRRIELEKLMPTFKDSALPDFGAAAKEADKLTQALSDGIIDYSEAVELGLSAQQAGALEASVLTNKAQEDAFNFAKTLAKVSAAFQYGTKVAQRYILTLAREALAKTQAAVSAVFGRPTQEVANLELQLAQVNQQRLQLQSQIDPQIQALQDQLDALEDVTEDAAAQASRQTNITGNIFQTLDASQEEQGKAAKSGADAQRKAIQDQIDSLERLKNPLDRQAEALEIQIQLYAAESEILQKQIQAADKTLLTQEEQRVKAEELIAATADQTQAIRDFSRAVGEDVIPEMDEFRKATILMRDVLVVAADIVQRKFAELGPSEETATTSRSQGGLITRPETARLHPPEIILPLSDPGRSRELLRSIPASISSAMRDSGPVSLFRDMNIQGETLDTMQAMAIRETKRGFREAARQSSLRRRGL